MSDTRKIAAILVADEQRTLARLRALRSDLIDLSIALHVQGRVARGMSETRKLTAHT
jgi:hypothetical protein